MTKARNIRRGYVHHIYENTVDGKLLFYSVSDYLVFFTLFCVTGLRYDIIPLSLCLMPDHFHSGMKENKKGAIAGMLRDVMSQFTREQNRRCGISGPLFRPHYGCALKKRDKDVRSLIIYIDNNPVERHLCEKAEQYRWNFLAYDGNPHPFSDPYIIRNQSFAFRQAYYFIKRRHAGGNALTYQELLALTAKLNKQEKEQLTDHIISTYSIIRHEEANRYFDSYQDRITADHSVSAREYDLNEVFVGKSDVYYAQMISIILRERGISDIHEILSYGEAEKKELFLFLSKKTRAPGSQIAKLLRMTF